MSSSLSPSTVTRPSGFSVETTMIRCHSAIDGTVAFSGACRQRSPTVTKPAQGRVSGNYFFSSERVHAGFDESRPSSPGFDGGRTGVSLQFPGKSLHYTPASTSRPTSSSAHRASSSSSNSSSGSSNGSQSSSSRSPGIEKGRYSRCVGCFRTRHCDNGNRNPRDVKGTRTLGTYRKQGNSRYDGRASETAHCGGGSGTKILVKGLSSPGKTFNSLVLTYLERTSAHALPRVARSRGRVRRILWIGTFVFFVGYFVHQLAALLDMFYSYPVGATIFIEQR